MPRRQYIAPRRSAQAAATRDRIVAGARRLFAQEGYGATTLTSVAEEAGVAIQTIYAAFGTKRAVLAALIDSMEAEAHLPELLTRLDAPGTKPSEQLALIVGFNRRLWERAVDVLEILRGASTSEPELADVYREGEARRRSGQASFIHGWAVAGALRPGVNERKAGDILWALSGPDMYRLLVIESGWPSRRYESWLADLLRHELFGLPAGPSADHA